MRVLFRSTEANRRNHIAYKKALAGIPGVSVLEYDPAERNSHHYIVLEVDEQSSATRDQIIAALHAENVLARKYFWHGCHGMKPFKDLFPNASSEERSVGKECGSTCKSRW